MAVEDVNNPKTVKEVDPKAAKEDPGDGSAAYWKGKAEVARAKHDYQAEEEALKMLGRAAPKPAFEVKGSLDLGNMNPAEAAKAAQDRADKQAEAKDKTIKEATDRAATAEANLQTEKVDGLRRDFGAQMATLTATIERLMTAKDTRPLSEQFKEQFTAAKDIAASLGLEKTTNGQDPMVAVELKKMEFAEAQKDREFKLKIAQDARDWEVRLIELKDNRDYQRAKLAQDERKNDMIAGFPAVIGSVLSKGTKARGGGQTVEEKAWKVVLSDGETNEFNCPTPGCGSRVGIGPTTEIAQCVKCQRQYPVERTAVPAGEAPASIEEPQPSEEE